MQIYNQQQKNKQTGQSNRSCSYCGSYEHIVSACDKAENDWSHFSKFQIPLIDPSNWVHAPQTRINYQGNPITYNHWFKEPSQWGTWYVQCEKAVDKIRAARLREQQKANAKSKGRKATKCGFCGGDDHNRRDCSMMEDFKTRLIKANQVWRQRFYDKLVKDLGISLGTMVKVRKNNGWNKPETEEIGLVSSINFDQLSLFCFSDSANQNWQDRIDSKFLGQCKIEVIVGGKTHFLEWKGGLSDSYGGLVDKFGSGYYGQNVSFLSVIAKSQTPLDSEWVEQGHENAIEFVLKKYSLEKLKQWNVIKLLETHEQINKKVK